MPSTVRPAGYKNFGRTTSTVLDIVRNDKKNVCVYASVGENNGKNNSNTKGAFAFVLIIRILPKNYPDSSISQFCLLISPFFGVARKSQFSRYWPCFVNGEKMFRDICESMF